MAERDEVYVIHPETLRRVAVPRQHFEDVLQPQGYVIDPNERSAATVDARTVRAAERKLAKAQATPAEDAG